MLTEETVPLLGTISSASVHLDSKERPALSSNFVLFILAQLEDRARTSTMVTNVSRALHSTASTPPSNMATPGAVSYLSEQFNLPSVLDRVALH